MTLIGKEIGELLVDNGLLTPEDLGVVEQEKLKTGESISKILARLGFASENQLKDTLELNYGVTFVSLAKLNPDPALVKQVPEDVIRLLQVVPISLTSSRLTLAMVNPDDSNALNEIRNYIQSDTVKSVVCIQDDFDTCLDQLFGAKEKTSPNTNSDEPTVPLEPDLSFIDDAAPLNVRAIGINTGENVLVDPTPTIEASRLGALDEANEVEEGLSDRPPPDLGELLLSKGIIDDDQLYDALKIGLRTKQSLAEVLILLELVTEEDLQFLLAEYFGSPLVESFEVEESAKESEVDQPYSAPLTKMDAPLIDDVEGLLSEDLPATLEDVVSDEQLGISDEIISEDELEFSEDMLSPEQLELLNRVMSQDQPEITNEVALEEQPEIKDEVLSDELSGLVADVPLEEEPELVDEADVEEQPEILDETDVEEEPEIFDEVVVEEEPEILDEVVVEEEPEILDEVVVEEEPETISEVVAEDEPTILDEVAAEDEFKLADQVVIQEEPEISDHAAAEEGPVLLDNPVSEELVEVEEAATEEEQPGAIEEVVAEQKLEPVDETAPEAVAEEEKAPAAINESATADKREDELKVEPLSVPASVADNKVQEERVEPPPVAVALTSEKSKQIAAARGTANESGDFKIVEEADPKPVKTDSKSQIAASSPTSIKAQTNKSEAATILVPDDIEDDIDFLDLVKQAQYASISLLANHVTSSAIEQKCSDILVQGISDNVVVQYLKKGRVVSESRLVKQILPDLVACYKEMAGLDRTVTNKPQDRKVKLNIRDTDIELRVTTVPEDDGEIVAISIKYI